MWGSVGYKQANSIYSAEIENRIKSASRPGAGMGLMIPRGRDATPARRRTTRR